MVSFQETFLDQFINGFLDHISTNFFNFHVLTIDIVHSHHCFVEEAPEDMFFNDVDLLFAHNKLIYSLKTIKLCIKTIALSIISAYR